MTLSVDPVTNIVTVALNQAANVAVSTANVDAAALSVSAVSIPTPIWTHQLVPDTTFGSSGAVSQVLKFSGFSRDDIGLGSSPTDGFIVPENGIYMVEYAGTWGYGRAISGGDTADPIMGYQAHSINKNGTIFNQYTTVSGVERVEYPNAFWIPANHFCSFVECTAGDKLSIVAYQQAPRARHLTAATNNSDVTTTMTLTSTYGFRTGDIGWLNGEANLITAVPSSTTVTVTRGFLGTTKVATSPSSTSIFTINSPGHGTPAGFTQGLFGAITNAATNIAVAPSTGFFTNDYVRVDDELMQITSVPDGSHINVTRGVLGTTATSHLSLALISSGRFWTFTSGPFIVKIR